MPDYNIGVKFGSTGIPDVKKAVTAFKDEIQKTQTGLKGITPGANQAGNALQNLGRVAQDAPFGFIGIQNNINPLLESFQRLKQESGSTGGALKALAGGLMGAAGLGLGLSVVTSLMTSAIQKYGSLSNAINQVFGLTSNLEQANRDLAKSFAEAEGSAGGEIATITALFNIAKNKALSDNARQEALNKLNKEYDTYLPKLTLENVATDSVRTAIDKLTVSLVRQSKIKGIQDLISKEVANQAQGYAKLLDIVSDKGTTLSNAFDDLLSPVPGFKKLEAINDLTKAFDKSEARGKLFKDFLDKLLTDEAVAGTLSPDEKDKKVSTVRVDQLKEELTAQGKIRASQSEIFKERVKGYLDANQAADNLVDTEQRIFDLNKAITIRDASKSGLKKDDVKKLIDAYQKDLQDAFNKQANSREGSIKVQPTVIVDRVNTNTADIASKVAQALGLDKTIQIPTQFQINVKLLGIDAANAMADAEEKLEVFKQDLLKIAQGSVENSIGAIGEGLGNLLAGGSLKDLVSPLVNSIGEALIALGKAAIKAGVTMKALKKALESLKSQPVLAIAIGVTAIAAGTALKKSFDNTKLPKFKDGGIATGPLSGYNVELHGRELIVPLDKINNMGSISPKEGMNVIPSINFSGDMFRIMLNKVDNRKRRV